MISDCYAGGVFDGEGSIGLYVTGRRGTYQMSIRVDMGSKDVVLAFQERFGGRLTRIKPRGRTKEHWQWSLTGSRVSFLQAILPHTIEKHTQVELALHYIRELGEGHGGMFTRITKRDALGRVVGVSQRTPEQKERQAWYTLEFKRLKGVKYENEYQSA